MKRLPASQRRRQLLDVALESFGTSGYHTTSMTDVAEAAGVTKPVLYQHFDSKRDLYLEVLSDVGARLREVVIGAAASVQDPRRRVEEGFRAFFEFFEASPASFGVLYGDSSRVDVEFAREVAATEAAIAERIADLITIEDLSGDVRRLLGHAIAGMAEAAVRHWYGDGSAISTKELTDAMAALAWAGLRGRRDDA